MKETVEILNELLQNSLLINVLVYAFISEFIIYFGIRNGKQNRFFYILIFASFQLVLINLFKGIEIQIIGIISIFSAIMILWSLNWNWLRKIIFKSRTNILINGWDTLGKEASTNSPLLVRVITKDDKIIYGIYANKSNISFYENLSGIFLEKIVNMNDENQLIVDKSSFGIWINNTDIFTIELLQKIGE